MIEIIQPQSHIIEQLIENKLSAINQLIRNNQMTTRDDQTRGDIFSSVTGAIQQYLSALESSDTSTSVVLVKRGNINSSALYNAFWNSIKNDLDVIYSEANNVGKTLIDQHNYITADIQNILIQLKTVNSSIRNYSLLTSSPANNLQIFIEKFIDTTKLDINSALLGNAQCNIDTIQGIMTLAVSEVDEVSTDSIDNIIIGAALSNGTIFGSTSLLDIINSNDFNLFQYELTSLTANPQKLVLDFTIKLSDITILNHIRIVPNNFGTKTWPTITALDISQDGLNFTSIKDMLLGIDNDPTQFILAPYTSNFAGEGRYTFLPQRALYIHFTIEQTTPYFDTSRNLFRWVIGLKDLELVGNQYAASSQAISLPYTFPAGVSKIALDADELPQLSFSGTTSTSKAQISHELSIDDGMSWKLISPEYLDGNDPTAPVILNVNNVDSQLNPDLASSINTLQQVTSVRWRVRIAQDSKVINDAELLPFFTPVIRSLTLKVFTQETV